MNELKKLRFSSFLKLTLSGTINASAIILFLTPANLFDSGFSGTSMFLASITGLPLGIFLILLNLPFFIFGYKRQGLVFTVYSLYAVLVYSVASFIMTGVIPEESLLVSPFTENDILLSAIFGGLISGIGSGLTIRFGGAIDGVEVLSVIFAKKLGITVGTFVMIYNIILYIIIGIVEQSWILPLYSVITYAAAIKAVDFIVEGLDKEKAAMIITSEPMGISSKLSAEFGSGVTLMKANGYYSNEQKTIVYFVVNRFQISKLKTLVTEADPNAFVTISEVSDILSKTMKG
ncbi:MAG: YitT family protein [Ruminiclostridium sp.]|nr:YitT family protein [Ruminiclostridium sp.]